MALEAQNVVVAGSGAVWVAPEDTPAPPDLAPLTTPWEDLGYTNEDGVTFTFSRDQTDLNAWQSSEPVRVLITAEPKTIAFNLLEFDQQSILLAFRGGTFTPGVPPAPDIYTPPDPGTSDVRAIAIDGVDGDLQFRFYFPRVQLSGDVGFQLVRTDAVTLSIELSVLAAASKWQIAANLPGFGVLGAQSQSSSSKESTKASAAA